MIMFLMVKAKHEKSALLRLFAHYLAKLRKTGAIRLLDSNLALGTNGDTDLRSNRKGHPCHMTQLHYLLLP